MEKEIDRTVNISDIDKTVKNKFKWEWLTARDNNGDFYSEYIRKLSSSGMALCKWCNHKINYGTSGQ